MYSIKETKQRLCIYVTYNSKQKAEPYIGYMLDALKKCCKKIYVVCNYERIIEGGEYLSKYADKIFFRENKGFDAGAYKDMLCAMLGWDVIYQYDELILMNDSFFGPFYNLDKYFETMENADCDFWGFTRYFSGELKSIGYKFQPHIQSYFLAFKNSVLKSREFQRFWEELKYPESFLEAIVNFEFSINSFLEKNKYKSLALTDVWGMRFQDNKNPFMLYAGELIVDNDFPILKKKSLLIRNPGFENALNAVYFLENKGLYSVNWIWDFLDRQFYIEGYASEGANCLEIFYKKYKKIYIYGAGVCGKNLALYFAHKNWKWDGFIVSDTKGQDEGCILFDDAVIDDATGIIISVIRKNMSDEIVRNIEGRCKREQLFIIYDCRAIRASEILGE